MTDTAVGVLAGPDVRPARPVISRGRRTANILFWACCSVALLLLVAPVVWILAGVVAHAVPTWHWTVLTEKTNGYTGGLLANIAGTFLIAFCVAIVAALVGIGAGVYLAEMRAPGAFPTVLRSASEILAGIPSIVFGYCGYLVLVVGFHWGYSLLPAVIVLAMLVVPYIMKATELSLNQVPVAYREGAEALGMSKIYLLRKIVMRAAIPGMMTGLIVAIAISVGETAPLLFTAGFTDAYPSFALIHHPLGYLTYAVYTYLDEPVKTLQVLSFDAAFILVIIVLLLILASRLIVRLTQKYSPTRASGGGGRAERLAMRANRRGVVTGLAEGLSDNRIK